MGNNTSSNKKGLKKEKKRKSAPVQPVTPRIEVDNEHSTNTAQSVNSILLTSNNTNNNDTLAQLNPDYPIQTENKKHLQQHKVLATSDFWPPQEPQHQEDPHQLTVGSINQLTVTSISSEYSSTTNIDDYIQRLLEAGYASKVSKQLCLKPSEVTAICRAAMDIFLSQPVL